MVADIISNVGGDERSSGIAHLDPKFARIYLPEKSVLLEVLDLADIRLIAHASVVFRS